MFSVFVSVFPFALICVSAAALQDGSAPPVTTTSAPIVTTSYIFTSVITPEPVPECEVDCIAHLDYFLSIGWVPYAVNTTITAATLEKTVYAEYNYTKTRLRPNSIPSGYTTQGRNENGTVTQTVTLDRGKYGALTTVLAYPTAITEYSNSYWWHGITPSPTAGATACATQDLGVTVQLPSHPEYMKWKPAIQSQVLFYPEDYHKKRNLDGNGYHAVPWIFPPNKNFFRQSFPNDTVLAQCRPEIDLNIAASSVGKIPTKTSAWFVTVTEVRTETECPPAVNCNVRRDVGETGVLGSPTTEATPTLTPPPVQSAAPLTSFSAGLMGNQGQPHPSQAGGAAPSPHGPILPRPLEVQGVQGAQGAQEAANGQRQQGQNGQMGVMGVQTAKTEKSATGLIVPTGSGKKPLGGDAGEPQSMVTPVPSPTPTVSRPQSAVDSLTIGGSTFSIAPLQPPTVHSEAHVESKAGGLVIGTQTASLGSTVIINNVPVVITTSAGSTIAIVQDKDAGDNSAASAIILNVPQGPSLGGIFAAKPDPAVGAAPVTVGSATLTPNKDGGYSVSGKSLPVGGSVTLGSGPSSTVLALTTDSSGHGVLVSNGKSTTLPSAPSATGGSKAKAAEFIGASNPSPKSWLHGFSRVWMCACILWGIILR